MIRKGFLILFMAQFLLPIFPSIAQDADIAGFEELIVRDAQGLDHIFYLSADGNMAFSGSLLDVRHKKNITQASYGKFVAEEIAKGIHRQQKFLIPYREDTQHTKKKSPLYLFLAPSCPDCLKLWNTSLPILSEKYDVRLSYGGLSSLGVKQVRKAMWGWCLKGDQRRAILTNSPLDTNVERSNCKPGIKAFNRMKVTFGRYIRHIPVAYNEQGGSIVIR